MVGVFVRVATLGPLTVPLKLERKRLAFNYISLPHRQLSVPLCCHSNHNDARSKKVVL